MRTNGPCGVLLAIAVFYTSGNLSAAEDVEAKDLFDQMEKKLAGADTIQLTLQAKLKADEEEGTVKASFWIAKGNKVRVEVAVQGGGKYGETGMVSNGAKMRSSRPGKGFEGSDTPEHLRDNLVYTLSRCGFTLGLMQAKARDETKPQKDNMLISDFRLEKRDKIKDREVHVLHYQFTLTREGKKHETTLYIDVETLMPVARTIFAFGLREEYLYQLNEKVGDDRFDLPKPAHVSTSPGSAAPDRKVDTGGNGIPDSPKNPSP